MSTLKNLCLMLLVTSNVICAAPDVASFAGGGAVGAIGGVLIYAYLSSRSDQSYHLRIARELKVAIENNKTGYVDQYGALNPVQLGTKIVNTVGTDPGHLQVVSFMKKVTDDLDVLKKQVMLAEQSCAYDSLNEAVKKDLKELIVQAKPIIEQLATLDTFVKKERPFIELMLAQKQDAERLKVYDALMNNNSAFPLIATVNTMETDIQKLRHWLRQAQEVCQAEACSPVGLDIIKNTEKQLANLEKKQKKITQSNSFFKERESFERLDVERKKAEAEKAAIDFQNMQAMLKNQENTFKLNEQKIKEEQLRQSDEKLRLNKLKLEQGKYFEPVKKQYESQISKLKNENEQLENKNKNYADMLDTVQKKELRNELVIDGLNRSYMNLQSSNKQLQNDNKNLIEKLDIVQQQAVQLDKHLHEKVPFNPESEEGMPEFLQKAYEHLQMIFSLIGRGNRN